jgi:aspartyl protease family protein
MTVFASPIFRIVAVVSVMVGGLLAQAETWTPRLRRIEALVGRHFRGESLEAESRRVQDLTRRFNEKVDARNKDLGARKAAIEPQLDASRRMEAEVEALDRELAAMPRRTNEEIRAYNVRIGVRNARVEALKALNEEVTRKLQDFNVVAEALDKSIVADEKVLDGIRGAYEARFAAHRAFVDGGDAAAMFADLNRVLAEAKQELSTRRSADALEAVERCRSLRRELADYAVAQQRESPNGLILVRGMLDGEPVCFIVDSGATTVTVSRELVDAVGAADRIGEESTHVLVGGLRIKGHAVTLDALEVLGRRESAVAASVLPSDQAGVDGLLGQSFLARFVVVLDRGAAEPVVLKDRPPRPSPPPR